MPVLGSTTMRVIFSGTLKGLASTFFTAFFTNYSNIGKAALDPVSNLPSGSGLSIPT